DERKALALRNEPRRNLLPVVLLQKRLVVEQIDPRRRAGHGQGNALLRLGGNLRGDGTSRLREHRVGLGREREEPLAHQGGERQRPDAEAGFAKEVAPRDIAEPVVLRPWTVVLRRS